MTREIVFTDSNFESEIRQTLGIFDRPITEEDTLQIKELDCTNFEFREDAEILRFFSNLVSLSIDSHINVLPALKYTPKLQDLDMALWGGKEINLRCFSHLKHLRSLFVSGGDVSDINMANVDALIGLPELRSLSFHEFGMVDLEFLEEMPVLEMFMCGWANKVKNLDSIGSLRSLKSLRLLYITMHDVDFLDAFPDSLKLEMSGTIENDVDISRLMRFTEHDICELSANGKRIPDSDTAGEWEY